MQPPGRNTGRSRRRRRPRSGPGHGTGVEAGAGAGSGDGGQRKRQRRTQAEAGTCPRGKSNQQGESCGGRDGHYGPPMGGVGTPISQGVEVQSLAGRPLPDAVWWVAAMSSFDPFLCKRRSLAIGGSLAGSALFVPLELSRRGPNTSNELELYFDRRLLSAAK